MIMADLVNKAREYTSSVQNERLAVLGEDWVPTDQVESDLVLTSPPQHSFPGMLISAGLMTWYVIRAPTSGGTTFRVINSQDGYEPTAVQAGTIMRLSPRFTDRMIFNHVNDQIMAMGSPLHGLYAVHTWQSEVNLVNQMYDIPVEIEGFTSVSSIRYRPSGQTEDWREIRKFDVHRTDGNGQIRVYENVHHGWLEFTVRMPFARAAYLTDNPVTACGLTESMLDIPPLGAAGILLQSEEGRRLSLQAQGDPRRSEESPPTGFATQGREFTRIRDQRIRAEAAKMASLYSYQLRVV